jgi:hypothetical protein
MGYEKLHNPASVVVITVFLGSLICFFVCLMETPQPNEVKLGRKHI